VNLCKAAQEVQEPRASSGAWTGREGTSVEDIATPREGLKKEKPHKENNAPREITTPAMKRHKNSHNLYQQKPTHNKAQHIRTKTIINNLASPTENLSALVIDNNDPHNRKQEIIKRTNHINRHNTRPNRISQETKIVGTFPTVAVDQKLAMRPAYIGKIATLDPTPTKYVAHNIDINTTSHPE